MSNTFTDFIGFISFMSLKSAISILGISENMPNASIKQHFPHSLWGVYGCGIQFQPNNINPKVIEEQPRICNVKILHATGK